MQEENQGLHRIVRPGQLEHAVAYRVMARGTTDMSMFTQATAKDMVLEAFMADGPPGMLSLAVSIAIATRSLSRLAVKALLDNDDGNDGNDDNDDNDPAEGDAPKPKGHQTPAGTAHIPRTQTKKQANAERENKRLINAQDKADKDAEKAEKAAAKIAAKEAEKAKKAADKAMEKAAARDAKKAEKEAEKAAKSKQKKRKAPKSQPRIHTSEEEQESIDINAGLKDANGPEVVSDSEPDRRVTAKPSTDHPSSNAKGKGKAKAVPIESSTASASGTIHADLDPSLPSYQVLQHEVTELERQWSEVQQQRQEDSAVGVEVMEQLAMKRRLMTESGDRQGESSGRRIPVSQTEQRARTPVAPTLTSAASTDRLLPSAPSSNRMEVDTRTSALPFHPLRQAPEETSPTSQTTELLKQTSLSPHREPHSVVQTPLFNALGMSPGDFEIAKLHSSTSASSRITSLASSGIQDDNGVMDLDHDRQPSEASAVDSDLTELTDSERQRGEKRDRSRVSPAQELNPRKKAKVPRQTPAQRQSSPDLDDEYERIVSMQPPSGHGRRHPLPNSRSTSPDELRKVVRSKKTQHTADPNDAEVDSGSGSSGPKRLPPGMSAAARNMVAGPTAPESETRRGGAATRRSGRGTPSAPTRTLRSNTSGAKSGSGRGGGGGESAKR